MSSILSNKRRKRNREWILPDKCHYLLVIIKKNAGGAYCHSRKKSPSYTLENKQPYNLRARREGNIVVNINGKENFRGIEDDYYGNDHGEENTKATIFIYFSF
ncbi:16792_t:CDS:2 [Entrophospora sp. SA101]|nr:16792_t:CDS:2 [Entrophospora sp. SA101]